MACSRRNILRAVEVGVMILYAALFLLRVFNAKHPLFLFVHAEPVTLSEWYPNFGWLIPYWFHGFATIGTGLWMWAFSSRTTRST